ncbi:Splicing factor 3B subunit 1 [Paramecium bursaria]
MSEDQVKKRFAYTAPQDILDEAQQETGDQTPAKKVQPHIEQQRKGIRQLSPERKDFFADDADSNNQGQRSYADIMRERKAEDEKLQLENKIKKTKPVTKVEEQKKSEIKVEKIKAKQEEKIENVVQKSEWEQETKQKQPGRWDSPARQDDPSNSVRKSSRWDQPGAQATPGRLGSVFETPTPGHLAAGGGTPLNFRETPTPGRSKAQWGGKTPFGGGNTPYGGFGGATPNTPGNQRTPNTPGQGLMTSDKMIQYRLEKELEERNRYLTDEDLNAVLPGIKDGYEVLRPPDSYKPLKSSIRKLLGTRSVSESPIQYQIPESIRIEVSATPSHPTIGQLPAIKPEEYNLFMQLLQPVNEDDLTPEQVKERKIMALLLKIKNGTPQMRKSALRQITQSAREFGPDPLFRQILPLLMSPTLEDQERHLLVKVIDRILFKLDDLVRPYVHKILDVIQPLLIHEDYYARVEAREIISNLAKAAGLPTMITTMRPDIDHNDDYIRNTTARAFAIVASALGIPALQPFLKAVCQSKKSWQARHTGIKIVQQISIFMGCAILPHLKSLVDIIVNGLKDSHNKVRTITALAIAALAEASFPYGIEAFDLVLIPLWEGINNNQSKSLAAFMKAIGFLIPLMDQEQASEYTKAVMPILKKEFSNSKKDVDMKKIVLMVLKQCIACSGIDAAYVRVEIIPEYFRSYWDTRTATDRRNYKQMVETTLEIAQKVGTAEILERTVNDLKNEDEEFRKMVLETIERVIQKLGLADVDSKLEGRLMDGLITAFHEHTGEDAHTMLNAFGTIINALGARAKQYFPNLQGHVVWRLQNKSPKIRQQAADLVAKIAHCLKNCQEETRLAKLGQHLFECLGEEYPEVLGSILGGLKAIVNVIGMTKMSPPIKDLLPRLTPILKNRHEKVQENCIDLVGRIADRGPEHVSPKEWIRICFDLLDLLKAHKKGIRRATINTFGYIAKAIGPQDVLSTLLNNLKVQERQLRVCTTVAIAIVAETCGPFTVLPALMNEYRVRELNVQNGVLKSLAFMFEYIGPTAYSYINAVIPLLIDALTDRDLVHRQTASSAVKHLSLGVQCLGCEDQLAHLMNHVWPNIFETSPHVINAVMEAIEGMRVSLGPGNVLLYTLQGLYHPARRVRLIYWRIYNMLYVGSQDALVAFYPKLLDENGTVRERTELTLML